MLDESAALAGWLEARGGVAGATDEFEFDPGTRPVLVTAIHATEHRRNGAPKTAEGETGALAAGLAAGAGYGRFAAVGPQTGDANFDRAHPFRTYLASRLGAYRLVLDLHIMRDSHGPDLCLALGPEPDQPTGRLAALAAHEGETVGLAVSVNWPFRAPDHTLTAFVQRQGTSAMQLEVAVRCQRPASERRNAELLIEWFRRLDAHIATVVETRSLAAVER